MKGKVYFGVTPTTPPSQLDFPVAQLQTEHYTTDFAAYMSSRQRESKGDT